MNRTSASYLIAAAILTLLLPLAGCSKPKAVVPTAYTTYMATDKAFVCDGPTGWANNSWASGATDSGYEFTSGDADIKIDVNSSGSLWGDITSSPGGFSGGGMGTSTPSAVPAADRVHAMQGQDFAQRLHDYVEVATDHTLATYGDGRVTEYKSDGIHGYRATILGHDRSADIDCSCSEAEFPLLKDAFLHSINSVKSGPGS